MRTATIGLALLAVSSVFTAPVPLDERHNNGYIDESQSIAELERRGENAWSMLSSKLDGTYQSSSKVPSQADTEAALSNKKSDDKIYLAALSSVGLGALLYINTRDPHDDKHHKPCTDAACLEEFGRHVHPKPAGYNPYPAYPTWNQGPSVTSSGQGLSGSVTK